VSLAAREDPSVTDDQPLELRIEVASRSPRPTGRLIAADGAATAFGSWLELLTALQGAIGMEVVPWGAGGAETWRVADDLAVQERSRR
jgi:hypothetical protein